jgi:hypothetical protein
VKQEQEGGQGSLCVLSPEGNYRSSRPVRVVVNLADLGSLPFAENDRLANVLPFGDSTVKLDPLNIAVAAGQPTLCQGFFSAPAFFAAVPAAPGVYLD